MLVCQSGRFRGRGRVVSPSCLAPPVGCSGAETVSSAGDRERDRDVAGRPRNARPRDELGRPLPRGAAGVEGVPDDLALSPDETLTEAQRLLDAGRAFQAHEVLESTWKAAPGGERELWRGLAQLAVGLTHARRGNAVGAVELLRRAAERVEGYADAAPHGVDVAGLVAWARALVVRIEQDGLAVLTRGDLTPQLRS
ncbi:DUF309 domain-containing protein [Micromonospora globispora]|uniref:DUF309 domain-containing protein n=1 Tax=Micromonospora globispora TaxID=1450148 RepID=UPI000D70490A|nr:DUF309 domain-containing protein [Micromonospora globispora]PWU61442.1 DUF309 domain-containing protein [Micromonospora globispora]RQX00359.1 DUF309 domain-containing protein [Micromonospora globispora]